MDIISPSNAAATTTSASPLAATMAPSPSPVPPAVHTELDDLLDPLDSLDPLAPLRPVSPGFIRPVSPAIVPPASPVMNRPVSPAAGSTFNPPVSPSTAAFNPPASPSASGFKPPASPSGFNAFGDVLQPQMKTPQKKEPVKLIQGDLDLSLAQMAASLNIGGPASQVKKTEHQWQPKGEHKKTGGANWAAPVLSSSTTWSMNQSAQQPVGVSPTAQSSGGPRMPNAGLSGTDLFGVQPPTNSQGQPSSQSQPNDPFGAL